MTDAVIAVMTLVSLSLLCFDAIRALKRRRQRQRGRRTVILAEQLRGELLQRIERLEDLDWSRQGHIRSALRASGHERFDDIAGPDMRDSEPAGRIKTLREKVETTCQGLNRLEGRQLEDRCFTLASLSTEVDVLAWEFDEQEVAWRRRRDLRGSLPKPALVPRTTGSSQERHRAAASSQHSSFGG